MAALACALAFSWTLLNTQTNSSDRIVWCGALFSIALLLPAFLDFISHGASALTKAQHLVAFGVLYWLLLDLVQQLYEIPLPGDQVYLGFQAIALFAAASLVGADGTSGPRHLLARPVARLRLTANRLFVITGVCFMLALIFYLFRAQWSLQAVLSAMLRGRGNTPWSRGPYGDTWAALEFLAYFGYLLPTLVLFQYRVSRDKLSARMIASVLMALFSLGLIASDGSRRSVGVMLLAALLFAVLSSPRHPTIRTSLRALAPAVLGGVVVLYGLNLLLQTRGNWRQPVSANASTYREVRVDDNFLRLCQTITAVPASAPYSGMQPLYFALVRPIPRALWPAKPTTPGFTIHEYLGYRGVSLSMSIIGELYTCFGFATILIGGLLYGRICRWWSSLLCLTSSLPAMAIYCVGYATLFVGIRSMIDLVLFTYPILAGLLLFSASASQRHPHGPQTGTFL